MLTRIPEQWLSRAILVDVSLALTGLALCLLLPQPQLVWRLVSGFAALACCLDALLAAYLLDHREK